MKKLREKGKKVYLIALNDKFPKELSKEGYHTIRIDQEWRHFFTYSYPAFFIENDFTIEKFRSIIANGDDRRHNQLRIDENGEIYLSCEYVGAVNIDGVQFRYETFVAYNGYLGPKAASDPNYIKEEYEDVLYGWQHWAKGYYDYPTHYS